ncbi:MAG TPA: ATP-binding protein [Thermoprotei archaeon]|nr:ATP-binding protein [Thermoprotei archaeon]
MEEKPVGFTAFDKKRESSSCVLVYVPEDRADVLARGKYVKVVSEYSGSSRVFVGRVVGGPFYETEGIDVSAAEVDVMVSNPSIPRVPQYRAVYEVEVLGEVEDPEKMVLKSTYTRPRPKSSVYLLSPRELSRYFKFAEGGMLLGHLIHYKGVKVFLDPDDINVLPRNIGVFGTVGSGKTNTAQVLIEEASRCGWAVVIVDVEGEYTFMDQPNDNDKLVRILESEYKLEPEGLKDFHVYVPVSSEYFVRRDSELFSISFYDLSLPLVLEIIRANEAQERRLSRVWRELEERVVRVVEPSDAFEEFIGVRREIQRGFTLRELVERVEAMADQAKNRRMTYDVVSYEAIASKLERLEATGIFDKDNVLSVNRLLKPGKVSVIDVSDASDIVKNIVISWLLLKIFRRKIRDPSAPKTLFIIEEAHTFVSRERVEVMRTTLDMLKTIARRGRKRWLSLCFISQQPGHLPTEIFELCNTRIVHRLMSEYNLKTLRETTAGVTREVWRTVPGLHVGEALLASPQLPHPVLLKIRPAKTMRVKLYEKVREPVPEALP